MYLARTEPLGPHDEAIRHILRTRGDEQLYNSSHFSLWRIANHRLQARQMLLREQPDPEQIAWVSKLNINRPDLHICADVLHMNMFSEAAKRLTQAHEDIATMRTERSEQARHLVHEIRDLISTIESWTSAMTGVWIPKIDDPQNIAQPQDVDEPANLPIPHFPCPQTLSYSDLWLVQIFSSKLRTLANWETRDTCGIFITRVQLSSVNL
jgi:hypothetical protein